MKAREKDSLKKDYFGWKTQKGFQIDAHRSSPIRGRYQGIDLKPLTATPWVKVADIPEETTTSVTSTTTTATTLTTTTNEEAIDELIIELHSESLDEPK